MLGLIFCTLTLPLLGQCLECPHIRFELEPWSNSDTWGTAGIPVEGDVVIDKPILLDTVTENLDSLVVVEGGMLVFDPAASLAKLVANRVTVDTNGAVYIGDKGCPFEGQAEILLTGNFLTFFQWWLAKHFFKGERNDDEEEDEDFGRKFIGVKAGGTLEIHGQVKKSWTKLTQTLTPNDLIFETGKDQPSRIGVALYEFDRKHWWTDRQRTRNQAHQASAKSLEQTLYQLSIDHDFKVYKNKVKWSKMPKHIQFQGRSF